MSSKFAEPPEKRVPTSHRLPVSTVRKIEVVRELWRAVAEANGKDQVAVEDINDTHVVSLLLASALDAELAEFGGLPVDDRALEQMKERIRKQTPLKK